MTGANHDSERVTRNRLANAFHRIRLVCRVASITAANDTEILRVRTRLRPWNAFDPVYLFLDLVIFERLFRPRRKNLPEGFERVTANHVDFILRNLQKHRLILWLNIAVALYLASGIFHVGKDAGTVVTGLLAPALITGGAWYAMSFGGIPEKFIGTALLLTFWMFLAFSLSMTLLIGVLCHYAPWEVNLFILFPIYAGLYIASMLYDSLDGLKIGLDTSLLKFARASLNYYQRQGLVTGRDTETDVFEEMSDVQEDLALFTNHMNMAERHLGQLDADPPLAVANHLIATSLDLIFAVIDMSSEVRLDRGEAYQYYLREAYQMDQKRIDMQTITYIEMAIDGLKAALPFQSAEKELGTVKQTLAVFKDLVNANRAIEQRVADHIFAQAFHQLLSLISGHRHVLVQRGRGGRTVTLAGVDR